MDWNSNMNPMMGQNNTFNSQLNPMSFQGINHGFNGQSFGNMPGNNQKPQQTYIPGKMVGSETDIIAQEVPMDGNFGTFIQKDLQKVYLKAWLGDGKIHTNEYVLVASDGIGVNGSEKPNTMDLILERLDRIESELKNQKKPYTYNQNYKTKKPYNKPANQEEEQK